MSTRSRSLSAAPLASVRPRLPAHPLSSLRRLNAGFDFFESVLPPTGAALEREAAQSVEA